MKTIFLQAVWLGKATVLTTGFAVTVALVMGFATMALAAVPGDPFRVGKANAINRLSTLVGSTTGFMLRIDNNGSGPALDLRVGPSTTLPANKPVPPMKVDSQARVVNLNSDELDGKDSTDFAKSYRRTVVVSPVSGDPTASGKALRSALQGITGAGSSNGYLLEIEPGKYNLGSADTPLVMKPFVDIQGSGEGVTLLTAGGSADPATATVVGADNAELRYLTVNNTGNAAYARAIFSNNASPRITHVTAVAQNGSNQTIAIGNDNGAATLTEVTADASGGNTSTAVSNDGGTPTLTEVTATAKSASTANYGIRVSGNARVTADRSNATASGGTFSHGVYVQDDSSDLTLRQVIATAEGASGYNRGVISSSGGAMTLDRVTAAASGEAGTLNLGIALGGGPGRKKLIDVEADASGGTSAVGLQFTETSVEIRGSNIGAGASSNSLGVVSLANSGSHTVEIDQSQITGDTGALSVDSEFDFRIGASQLAGRVLGFGTSTCAGSYNGNYVSLTSNCA